jgi:predicted dinucleotide-binding enzyme
MRYAVLGTGQVGRRLADALVKLNCPVTLGSRMADNAAAREWAAASGGRHGTFADAAGDADVVILAVSGQHALAVVEAAGAALNGKIVVDLTNPLDFSQGFPPRLSVCNDDSLGEQIQRAAPTARVVKALNTLSNTLMAAPDRLPEATDVFVAGEDAEAKQTVSALLRAFGHRPPIDLGGIEASRGLEAWLLLWTRLYGALGTSDFNLRLVRNTGE